MKNKFCIVDVSAYVFRAYYGVRPLTTSAGIPTQATYGVITMMNKLIRELRPQYLVMAFDSPTPSFRKDFYPDYKANREIPPEDLALQFDQIKEYVALYPFASLQKEGFEADDIIATLVEKYHQDPQLKETEIVIVSGDKDLMQLVRPGVCQYESMRENWYREEGVLKKFDVKPTQILDLLSLMGDSSDNIPGVRGVGPKTAAKLIQDWGSLDGIYENLGEIKEKLAQKLEDSKENAYLSKKLVTLESQVPLEDISLDDFKLQESDVSALNEFFKKYEFKRLIKEDLSEGSEKVDPEDSSATNSGMTKNKKNSGNLNYECILEEKDLDRWVKKIQKKGDFAFDTETTGLDRFKADLVGISLSCEANEACYIPISHRYLSCPKQLDLEIVVKKLKPIFEDKKLQSYAQNVKFDRMILERHGLQVKNFTGDSLLASYILSPETSHKLDSLAKEYLDREMIPFTDIVKKGETFESVELDKACDYASEDADVTYQLIHKLHEALKEENLWNCYHDLELPLVDVLYEMERDGILLDESFLEKIGKDFADRLKKLEKKIFKEAGEEFNINSPKQLGHILFDKLGLPPQKKKKTGYSTDVTVLTVLSRDHALPQYLLEHRSLSKLLSTYVEQLKKLQNPKDHRIHTSYNQTIAATGRLSSSDPNLQNIPIRTEEGRKIRRAFVPKEACVFVSADYSQIELRLLAEFSKDPSLMTTFKEEGDIHAMTAEKIFGSSEKEFRAQAKTVNFGVLYGQSAFGLAKQLEIPQGEAKAIIDAFYKQFPSVLEYKEKLLHEAAIKCEVRTWQGRRRSLPELRSPNKNLKNNAERMAFNTIFQGSAADLIKVAMLKIQKKIHSKKWKSRMLLQVHDELVFEVDKSEKDEFKAYILQEMEHALEAEVPLKVEIGEGQNWDEAH